jgi:hypothetical protein
MSETTHPEEKPFLESRMVPVMREAVATVQLILFAKLKSHYEVKHSGLAGEEQRRLAGAVVSDLFGSRGDDDVSRAYARKNLTLIEQELRALAPLVEDLLGPLTDALRMQTICDNQEGVNSLAMLLRARAVGILQEDRELPMPSTFMLLVRNLGVQYGVLEKMAAAPPPAE